MAEPAVAECIAGARAVIALVERVENVELEMPRRYPEETGAITLASGSSTAHSRPEHTGEIVAAERDAETVAQWY
jgi:hypothetical protein